MQKIETRSINDLIPYARNARTHSDEQVAQIAASLKEFGWTNPILIDGDNGIIAGHGRLMAARKLRDSGASIANWANHADVPVISLAHMTDTQKRAYIIADNKLALNAGWDDELLRVELDELHAVGFDLEVVGFSGDELSHILYDEVGEAAKPSVEPESAYKEQYAVIVVCKDSAEQETIFNKLDASGYNVKVVCT